MIDDKELIARLLGWARDIQTGSTDVWAMDQDLKAAADRIESLETKLAQAVEALELIDHYGDIEGVTVLARAALATIKGDKT